jgi:hypothetical protein
MKDINDLSEGEQLNFIKNNFFFSKRYKYGFTKITNDDIIVVGEYYVSLNRNCICNSKCSQLPLFFIRYIENPSEEIQKEIIRSLDYNKYYSYEIARYIKAPKARELFNKLKKAHELIK